MNTQIKSSFSFRSSSLLSPHLKFPDLLELSNPLHDLILGPCLDLLVATTLHNLF